MSSKDKTTYGLFEQKTAASILNFLNNNPRNESISNEASTLLYDAFGYYDEVSIGSYTKSYYVNLIKNISNEASLNRWTPDAVALLLLQEFPSKTYLYNKIWGGAGRIGDLPKEDMKNPALLEAYRWYLHIIAEFYLACVTAYESNPLVKASAPTEAPVLETE